METIWYRWSFYGEYFYSDAKASYFVFPVVGCIYTVIRGVEVCTEQCIKLYRIVEFVGRWSMIDVFVVALLTALIQIQSLATILAGRVQLLLVRLWF